MRGLREAVIAGELGRHAERVLGGAGIR